MKSTLGQKSVLYCEHFTFLLPRQFGPGSSRDVCMGLRSLLEPLTNYLSHTKLVLLLPFAIDRGTNRGGRDTKAGQIVEVMKKSGKPGPPELERIAVYGGRDTRQGNMHPQ